MKKMISLFTALCLTAVLATLASCSSTPTQTDASLDPAQIEPEAQNDAFTALTAETPTQPTDSGAIQDTSPPTYLADASTASNTANDGPRYSAPVDLGASSAGRAH